MREQVVAHEDGLGVLEVRAPRHDCLPCTLGLRDESIDDVEQLPTDDARLIPKVHANECGDLVIARASRADLAAECCTSTLKESAFERGVDVLIIGPRCKDAGNHFVVEMLECIEHLG